MLSERTLRKFDGIKKCTRLPDASNEVEWRAVCGESRKHGSEGGQGFLRVRLPYPTFGEAAINTKAYLEEHYLDTKNDVLQAFAERGYDLLEPGGLMGAITSRTPFFLSSAQAWRERVVLRQFRPQLLADFGIGVLEAMVETAAYVLRSINVAERQYLMVSLLPELLQVEVNKQGNFSIPKYMKARSEPLKRHHAEQELHALLERGFIAEDRTTSHRSFYRYERVIRHALDKDQSTPPRDNNLLCVRLLKEEDKGAGLRDALQEPNDARRFEVNPIHFADVPGAPFAYWVSDRVRSLFKKLPPFESNGRKAQHGLSTNDDFRFLRLWWEVPSEELCPPDVHPLEWTGPYCVLHYRWFPFAKGGAYSPYYADLHLVVSWYENGREIEADTLRKYPYLNGDADWVLHRESDYFRPGLTWSNRTTRGISFRAYPAGSIFAHKGPVAFTKQPAKWLSILQSSAFEGLISLQLGAADAAARSYEIGLINSTPVPQIEERDINDTPVRQSIAVKMHWESRVETTHIYQVPSLLTVRNASLNNRIEQISHCRAQEESLLRQLLIEGDVISYQLFGLSEKDLQALELSLNKTSGIDEEEENDAEDVLDVDAVALIHDLLSYFIGVTFGRWDVRYVTGKKELPELPDSFVPLPVCPPGMLLQANGLPAGPEDVPVDYSLRISWPGILVDDEGHPEDIISRVREALEIIWQERASDIEHEACDILSVKSLRDYFAKPNNFFAIHLKRYSKSRRQAPIYWPLQTPSGSYTLWFYVHRLTGQTLYTCVNDFVGPKLKQLTEQLDTLRAKTGRSKQEDKELERLLDFEQELKDFRDELLRVARFWKPNLNDGVQITAAPLWKLFRHKPWQKTLKDTWEKLANGAYDWAHLAYSIWPDRVRDKCKHDKSLAIAHGLEALYEAPPEQARKKRGRTRG